MNGSDDVGRFVLNIVYFIKKYTFSIFTYAVLKTNLDLKVGLRNRNSLKNRNIIRDFEQMTS